jgi:uncharacterized protein YbdZ (MbtH family)
LNPVHCKAGAGKKEIKMSRTDPDMEDTTIYKVVVNQEEQYSIWPEYRENPLGWRDVGKVGPKDECLCEVSLYTFANVSPF